MSTAWRMDLPEGWVAWEPGAPDVAALQAAATTTPRAARALARRVGVVEKEVTVLPGDVRQVGMRMSDARTGFVSASMYLTQWARPTTKGKPLTARQHLTAVEQREEQPDRVYRHREASVEKVPAGQLVLRNELWRPKWKAGWNVTLETTIFPRGTDVMFELSMSSRHADLQPQLMAEISLMAHSFALLDTPA